jgi:hypothetical protein
MEESQWIDAAKAVIEHHFDDHRYCGAWCPRRGMSPEQLQEGQKYYRNKTKDTDAKLYATLTDKLCCFITLDRLQEVAHGMDSQVNESLNNTISWLAPKNKVYCGSRSLANRVGIAVGINSLGMLEYFTFLFKALGINMTDNVKHFLSMRETSRSSRLNKIKLREMKNLRNLKKYETLKKDTLIAQKERAKRDGTYRRGMNMDGEDELKQPARPRKKQRSDVVCKHCQLVGHSTTRSKSCLFYKGVGPPTNVPAAASVPTHAADDDDAKEDQGRIDWLPIEQEQDSDQDDLFYDTGTWSGPEDAFDEQDANINKRYVL